MSEIIQPTTSGEADTQLSATHRRMIPEIARGKFHAHQRHRNAAQDDLL
jgi:hypothetical protein